MYTARCKLQNILCECPLTSRPGGAGSCDGRVGGPGSKGAGHTRRRGRPEKHPAGAVGDGVEERVRRAAQRRRLPVVGHHRDVREGAARAEASDGAALPAIVGPPVEHSPAHQRSTHVTGRRRLDREACRRDRRWRDGGAFQT